MGDTTDIHLLMAVVNQGRAEAIEHPEEIEVPIAIRTLMKKAGLSKTTVEKSLARLENKGWMSHRESTDLKNRSYSVYLNKNVLGSTQRVRQSNRSTDNNNSVTLSDSLSTLAAKDISTLRWRAGSVGKRKALIIYRLIELGGEVKRINSETDLGMKPKSFDYHFRGTKERLGLEPMGIVEQVDRGTYRLTRDFIEVIREIRRTSGEDTVEARYDARISYDRDKWNDRNSDTFEEDYERYLRDIGLL